MIKLVVKKKSKMSTCKKTFLSLFCFLVSIINMQAQSNPVSGTVIDELNEPLAGVSIVVEGTTTGTITDYDGKFTISAKKGDVLVFSFVGMEPQKVTLSGQTTVDIKLQENANLLTETVVIGYGSAKKRDLTGSIVRVDASAIKDRPSANPMTALQGKISGVQVVNTGRAGQDPEIRIRGTNSIDGYKPLYVVDGLFSDNINYLNPSDIESLDILKDPSSLAIFGVRGANGVIIVTTKRAKEGQVVVNINSSLGYKHVSDRMKMTNAEQFKLLYNEQLLQQNQDPFDYTNWGADTDWQSQIFRTGFLSNNNVSITGASEKNRFYVGVGYQSEEGVIKSEKYGRATLNMSSDFNVTKFLRFGFQVNGSRTTPPDAKNVGNAIKAAPIAPVYANYYNEITEQNEQLVHTMPAFQRAQLYNPMYAIDLQGATNRGTNYRGAGNVYGEVDFLSNFNFRATFSLDYRSDGNRQLSPFTWVYNPEIGENGDKENISRSQRINQGKSHNLSAQQDYILTYSKAINKHSITAMGGITTNYKEYSQVTAERSQELKDADFFLSKNNPDKWYISSLPEGSSKNGSSQNKRFTMSYLVRGLYNYDNKYLLNASYRRDGSSVFKGVGNTWDNFYSFGGGWVVSQESFMSDVKFFDYLKLKGSWGVLGSENTGGKNYPSYPILSAGSSAVFGDNVIKGYTYNTKVRDLHWEKTYAWEIGLEFTMLDQRLTFEPTYYKKRTKDIIVELTGVSGVANSLENFGEIENKGIELAASWNDRIGSTGIGYAVSANFTTINNKVISLGKGDTDAKYDNMSRTVAGHPIAYFYGYKVEGVYQNYEDIKQSPTNKLGTVKPGDLKFADIDGDGEITVADRTMIGNPTPDFTYGFNLGLNYKGFDLGVDMMGVYGNEIYRNWDNSGNAQFNYRQARLGRWNGEGTSNWEPILDPSRSINREYSSYYIEDGSFFRIRNIQLGYTFDPNLLKKAYIKTLRIFANIENVKTWSNVSGFTPEIGGGALSTGVDSGTYPIPVAYTFGVNLSF